MERDRGEFSYLHTDCHESAERMPEMEVRLCGTSS